MPAFAAPFAPEAFFAGATRSKGALTEPDGTLRTRFTGETRGQREADGATTFDQTIRYDDGTTRQRRWRVVRTGPTTIEATGTDVVGVARGTISGRTLHLVSTILVDQDLPFAAVDFDQVMTLDGSGRSLRNRSTISLLGAVVRRVDETFVKLRGR